MSSSHFGAVIELEDQTKVTRPVPVLQKPLPFYSLDQAIGNPIPVPAGERQQTVNAEPDASLTPRDLERSIPSTPQNEETVGFAQTWKYPYMNRYRYFSACIVLVGHGLNDSAPGALIPYIEKKYNIGYAVVSTIFISNAVGFISAAFIANILHLRFGRAKTLAISQLCMLCGFIPIVVQPPFPVVVVSFFFLGLGMALANALLNTFCANLANTTQVLGGFHGSYGIGGTVGPLIATALAVRGYAWSTFYFLGLSISIFNLAFATWSFWNLEKEPTAQLLSALEQTASRQAAAASEGTGKSSMLKKAVKSKVTILGALFIFAYQGAEVSISGWVISFLVAYRNGKLSQLGYVTAGFWAGITIGRFGLSYPAQRIGEKTAVFIMIVFAAVFELLVWFVPNAISNAVAVSIVGLALGPVYPCATTIFARLIPRKLQITSLSFISALGSSGGAAAPFATGLLAQAVGTFVLHPICIGLFLVMSIAWFLLPRVEKKKA